MRSFTFGLATVGLAAATSLAMGGSASAAPDRDHVGNPRASCLGTGQSEHGANDPAGTVADEVAQLRQFLQSTPYNRGDVISRFAQLDATTHEECERLLLSGAVDFDAPRGRR